MSFRFWARLLPALAVVTLFVLVAASPSPTPAPQMPIYQPAPCTQYAQSSGGASTAQIINGDGVVQPLSLGATMVACSLHVAASGWSYANLYIRDWDPLALAPDPSTIALRSAYLDPSRMNYYTSNNVPWVVFSPPVISASVPGVAEAPSATVSMEVLSTGNSYGYALSAYYEPSGNPNVEQAQSVAGGGSHQPLLGTHPVLGHAVCAGDEALQELRVVQSVKRTDVPLTARPYEIAQKFHVPQPVELRWIELAVSGGTSVAQVGEEMPVASSATLAIVEAPDAGEPPPAQMNPLGEALFENPYMFSWYSPAGRWASHVPLDWPVLLYPGHEYWIYLRDANGYAFFTRTLTGTENGAFTAGVGELYMRNAAETLWTPVSGSVLSFKAIGLPLEPLRTSPPRPRPAAFSLSVTPNPANGPLHVEWSGAVGPVRLEVFDARGRRVGRGEGGAAGTWSLSTTARDGRPLAAGVYYVHARDSQGQQMVERAVIVR